MAIDYTTLFTRLGNIGGLVFDVNTFQGTTLPTGVADIVNEYVPSDENLVDGINVQLTSAQSSSGTILSYVRSVATNTVNQMVNADAPQLSNTSLQLSVAELIRQMKADGETVEACVVAGSATAGGSNLGDGVCVVSVVDQNGLAVEYALAETVSLSCTQDSTSSSITAGNERFSATGQYAVTNTLSQSWPAGSGSSATVSVINAEADAGSQGTLINNGDFEDWTETNVPDNFEILVGTAGTTVQRGSTPYSGTYSLQFIGNGTEQTSVTQTFDDTDGTTQTLSQGLYAVSVWVRVSSTPAAGVLTVDLIDGTNTVIDNQAGNPNSFSLSLPTLSGGTWVNLSGVFQFPHVIPAAYKLRLRLSTALTAAVNLFIDHLAFGSMTTLYAGGPALAVFSGATPFYSPDSFSVAITNDRGGASATLKNFQTLFDRLFSMRLLGLTLPSSGSPTISDSLIS